MHDYREVIPMDYRQAYNDWLENPYFDEATKEELRSIANDDNEIRERFYTDLEFGTAGLQGRDRCRNEPHEHLYRTQDDPGTGELHLRSERTGARRGHRF